ncbi:MAG: hypothetical protein ABI664_02465 [bacterium]
MADVRIAHWRTRYRMPADAVRERPRLDGVLKSALDDELFAAALQRAGIPAGEEICIRRVESVVRLDSGQPDGRLAVAWSVALADAIAQCVSAGGPDVIRYGTRFVALVDMACSAARGDLERAWAWRSLGIWHAPDARDAREACAEVIEVLTREPRLAPATLGVVARRGLLPPLIASVPADRWVMLARTSLVASGVSEADAERLFSSSGSVEAEVGEDGGVAATTRAVARMCGSSALLDALREVNSVDRLLAGSTIEAIAAMALLDCEPALVASADLRDVVRSIAQHIAARAVAVTADKASRVERVRSQAQRDEKRLESPERRPTELASGAKDEEAHGISAADVESPDDARTPATTAWGGLLFLLHIVHAVDLPAVLQRDSALNTRSLRWTLHQLAMLIAPIAADDPAALAFAGLAPGSRCPSDDEQPPTEAELAAVHSAHAVVVAAVRERINAIIDNDEPDAALIHRVTSRNAEIVAEPAWIEVRLLASEIDTNVRRAGLDLDPGWIPWLGAVVRFTYV